MINIKINMESYIYFTFILLMITSITAIDNNLHAVIISTSHTFENYRHSTNSMMMYQYFKSINIPDHKIIFALSEAHTCSPRMKYPGKIYLPDTKERTCQENLFIDYKETDIYNFKFLDILRGRSPTASIKTQIRKLNTNKNSRILIYITSHGGEGFIKFRGKNVVLSEDLNRALIEMYSKGRYKEILFILDTCEAFTLYDYVNTELAPNIFFIGSSKLGEKASSINYDKDQMTPLADRFSYLLFNFLEQINKNVNFDFEIYRIFEKIQSDPQMKTSVSMSNTINRNLLFKDYFGDSRHYRNSFYSYIFKYRALPSNNFDSFSTDDNSGILLKLFSISKTYASVIDEYHDYSNTQKKLLIEKYEMIDIKEDQKVNRILTFIFNGFFFFLLMFMLYFALFKE